MPQPSNRPNLRIHGYAGSINVRKVLWLCAELGLDYERIDWGGGTRPVSDPEFLRLNPVGMIPVIEDGDVVLWESNSILRYLARKHARVDLLPLDPAGAAKIERWMDWQVSDFNNSWRYAFMATVRKNPAYTDEEAIARSMAQFNAMVTVVADELDRNSGHIAGESFTLADIPIGLSIHRWKSLPLARPDLPTVERYYERLCARDGFRRYGRDGGP